MPMLQELLQPRPNIERRAIGRMTINRVDLMCFSGQDGRSRLLCPRRDKSRRRTLFERFNYGAC
jgi:hypothetical protein